LTSKQLIRQAEVARRMALSAEAYEQLNRQLRNNFFSFVSLNDVKTLHVFLPITSKREPDTWLIIDRIADAFPQIRLVVPKMTGTGILSHFYFEGRQQLKENHLGISEPKTGIEVAAAQLDMVLVPLLAFDRRGHRIGYGKGFYDRFLSRCRPGCQKIGLSLFEPVDSVFNETHDVALNAVVASTGFYPTA